MTESPQQQEAALVVVEAMTSVISQADLSEETISFHGLEAALHQQRRDLALSEPENFSAWADAVAFGLVSDAYAIDPWGLYFGPMGSGTRDGQRVFIPEVRDLSGQVLDLWQRRLESVSHPALRARYSDLIWELGPVLGRKARKPEYAREAMASYEAMVVEGKCQEFFDPDAAVLRLLTLALSLRDDTWRECALELLLDRHRIAINGPSRINLEIVDRLMWERNLRAGDEIISEIIADLEVVFALTAGDGEGFDPFLADLAAKRLLRYHLRKQSRKDVKRVHSMLAQAFERLASLGNAMAAASHLDKAATEFARAGDEAAHTRVRIARAAAVEDSNAEMTSHSVEMKVTFDQMEEFLEEIVVRDNGPATLMRVANRFVAKLDDLRERVLAEAQTAPLQAAINVTIFENEHVAAIVGGVDADMEGRIMLAAGQHLMFESMFLNPALERSVDVHGLSPYDLAGWAGRLGAFDDLSMLSEGIMAWFDNDWVKALHVLVPQIETGLRGILKSLAQPVVRDHPAGAGRQVLLNMGEVLASPATQAAMGEDLILYFRARYVDPRARNLRNVVAHGLTSSSDASASTCDVLIHSLLVIGCWQEIAAHRKQP